MFAGFDHVDTRVSSIALVEPFYDCLMPKIGLPRKRLAYVDERGDWHDAKSGSYNAVEYYEDVAPPALPQFIGFIEDGRPPSATRIAFALPAAMNFDDALALLEASGAKNVELSAEMGIYPAVFFEDPGGTRLELCRRVR
ncbi:MAG: hypothetical protein JOZ38_06230 [Candidatus Eremiobacteraeota bacterium]|nr:hypothetical protein [Candidatus Eremiobacteraeota bacterium]